MIIFNLQNKILSMEDIKEIVFFISKKKLRHIETLNMDEEGDSIYRDFYYLLLNEPNITEEDVAKRLTNTDKKDKKYAMLKSRFKKRIYNHLLFLGLSETSTENNIIFSEAYKSTYIAKLLQINSLITPSYEIVRKNLKTLIKYQILESLITAYQIILNYQARNNQFKKFDSTKELLMKYSYAFIIEIEIQSLYEKAGILYSKSEILSYADTKKLFEIINRASEIVNDSNILFKAQWLSYVLLMEYYEYIGDVEMISKNIVEVENLLKRNKIMFFKVRKLMLFTWQLKVFGEKKLLSRGEKTIKELFKLYDKNNINSFYSYRKILDYYVVTNQYRKALDLAINTINNSSLQNIGEKNKELWLLWHTYLQMIGANYNQELLNEIKIAKVLNSVPQISKDKLGLNTLVRTLEIVYRYLVYDDENLIETYNALLIYKSRYLKPNKLRRAQIFFDMLTAVSKGGYTNQKMKQQGEKALKRYERLKNDNPERKAYEFIPYEKLIEIMMGRPPKLD